MESERSKTDSGLGVDPVQLRRELRRGAVWTVALVVVLIGVYYLILEPYMDPVSERASRQTETSYQNRALEIAFTLPDGWEFAGEDQLEMMSQQLLANADGADGRQLMIAHKPGSMLNVHIQCLSGYKSQDLDGEHLKELVDQSQYIIPEVTVREWMDPIRLGKLTYEPLHIRHEMLGMDIDQYGLIAGHRDYVVMIFLTGEVSEHPETLLDAFS